MALKISSNDTDGVVKIKEAVTQYINSKDIPKWYRAYSRPQIQAADELMSAIRDDVEQETTHRVRDCLSVLGIEPMLNNKNLQTLMKLSGGNDLAFLWFLMDFNYKTPSDTNYSLNEQLILSGIAHLDMITTIRGLDGILPPGHESKRTLSIFRAGLRKAFKKSKSIKAVGLEKWKKCQPYFEKLERPKELQTKSRSSQRPEFKVKFDMYEKYKDPSYEPPNEINRWFTMYKLRDSLRVSVVELRSLFNDVFKILPPRGKVGPSTALNIIDKALIQMNENMDNSSLKSHLCLGHQQEREELQQKRRLREVIERERCLKNLELFRKQREERMARIQKTLEKEVNMYRKQYRDEYKKDQRSVHLLDKESYSEYPVTARDLCDNEPECIKPTSYSKPPATKVAEAATLRTTTTTSSFTKPQSIDRTSHSSSRGSKKGRRGKSINKSTKQRVSKTKTNKAKRARGGSTISFKMSLHNYHEHQKSIQTSSSQLFFQSATRNQPYKFNYENIFNDELNDIGDAETLIKIAFIAELKAKDTKRNLNEPLKLRPCPNVSDAAEKYANSKWDEYLEKHRLAIYKTRKAIGLQSLEDLVAQQHKPTLIPGMPQLDFYDCEDKELMHHMLKIAINHLAKNRKYVLASLPDCDKLPDLREWIYQRYGKRYTQTERKADFEISLQILNGLIELGMNVRSPRSSDIGNKLEQTYKCHKHIRSKVNRVRNKYFTRTRLANMEFARLIWFTMNNFLCSISQREMFFAYLPQRLRDICLVNPWKLHQKKNMKYLLEQRRLKLIEEAASKF